MRKKSYYSLLATVIGMSFCSFAIAAEYDDLVNNLANSIFTQIQNDVPPPPVETTGEANLVVTPPAPVVTNPLPAGIFVKKESAYALTTASLNERLNGGILVKESTKAINYLYDKKLTKFNTPESFQENNPLRRDEAAKFFSLFASQVMAKTEDAAKTCTFKDLAEGHTDLTTNVTSSCKLGIFKGSNGFFNPTKSITNGEALTVLIRIIHGNMDETSADHRAKNYWQKAQTYGLTQGSVVDSMSYLDKPATRGDIARMLEAARVIPLLKKELGSDISYSLIAQGFVPVK